LRSRLKDAAVHERKPEIPFITARVAKRTIPDLMTAYQTHLELEGGGSLSPQNTSTISRVQRDFTGYALALTKEKLAEYMQRCLQAGDRPATINRRLQALRAAYRWAELPAPRFTLLSEADNVRQGFFTAAEIRAVMAVLPADLSDFVLFGWLTGMRKGEIASLRWEDVDGDRIILRGASAKNGCARTIPCVGELAELLERRRQRRAVNCSLIFHRGDGHRVGQFRKSWLTACRLANCPDRLFHDLRRSAVRDMIRSKVPQTVARSISGHKTNSIFDRYNVTDDHDQREALQRMQQYRQEQQVPVAPRIASVN
jgi:integrase